jgi:hypothetical protein
MFDPEGSRPSREQRMKGERDQGQSDRKSKRSEYFDFAQHKDPAMQRSHKAGGGKAHEYGIVNME